VDLQKVFDSIAQKLAIDFDHLSSQIKHSASKGRVREIELAEEFLRIYLPRTVGIGHGEIIATNGDVSNENDLVFFESTSCPLLIEKTGYQVFPIECVHAVMEVKSNLDGKELGDAFTKISRVKRFPKTAYEPQSGPVIRCSSIYDQEWEFFPTLGFVFAYDSIGLDRLRQQLDELQADAAVYHRIDLVCVLKKGAILNWDDSSGMLNHTPNKSTRLRAMQSDNPLLILTVFLQQLLQSAWTPKFRIKDYLKEGIYGRFIDAE